MVFVAIVDHFRAVSLAVIGKISESVLDCVLADLHGANVEDIAVELV